MDFQIIGLIEAVETIAEGNGIRDLAILRKRYGLGRWRKKKGIALVRLPDGRMAKAEVHWYEAHGIGKVNLKVKEWL
ncbi:MAG: hypothetical protein ACYDDT_11935 [Sulfuricella sp.]